jgi:hypothetical protein
VSGETVDQLRPCSRSRQGPLRTLAAEVLEVPGNICGLVSGVDWGRGSIDTSDVKVAFGGSGSRDLLQVAKGLERRCSRGCHDQGVVRVSDSEMRDRRALAGLQLSMDSKVDGMINEVF